MKYYLHANKKGFISVYALVILLIYSSFALLLSAQVQTLYLYQKNASLCDICILHTIQSHIEQKDQSKENDQLEDQRDNDDLKEQSINCLGTMVTILFEERQAQASYLGINGFVHMNVFYPEGFIEQYEYE